MHGPRSNLSQQAALGAEALCFVIKYSLAQTAVLPCPARGGGAIK